MNLFEIVKYGVSCREAAERYGVEVNHYGMALCPFHNDRHPSLYVADDHYHCFACGEHGDVIDFVGKLFQLSPYDAARKLMADFHLSPDKPPSAAALHAKRIRTEAQQLMENERLCFSVLSDYARVLRDWKVSCAPQSPYDAARKLMADFHLSPDKPPSAAALHAKRIRTEAQQLMENERLCFSVLSDYARVLRDWKVSCAPQSSAEAPNERFVEACHKLDEAEYYLEILTSGDSHERTEVIQQQMADSKLDRLRQRLEKIHKEETEDGYDTAGVA